MKKASFPNKKSNVPVLSAYAQVISSILTDRGEGFFECQDFAFFLNTLIGERNIPLQNASTAQELTRSESNNSK